MVLWGSCEGAIRSCFLTGSCSKPLLAALLPVSVGTR